MEEFNKITAEPLVLTPLPDKSMVNLVRLKQRLQLLDQSFGCSWRILHQILSPVEQPHIGTEGPSVQGIVNVVPQTGPWHEAGHIRFAEPRVKRLQPTGCNELGEPGDIHQQSIEGGRSEQQAADGRSEISSVFLGPRVTWSSIRPRWSALKRATCWRVASAKGAGIRMLTLSG